MQTCDSTTECFTYPSIRQLRSNAGEGPRRLGLLGALRFRQRRPEWLEANTPLQDYFDAQSAILQNGRVVWAWIVKANAGLYAPGRAAAPGVAVWSAEPCFDARPRLLKHVADHVDALRRFPADADPELGGCVKHARDDSRSQPRCAVPHRLTDGRTVCCGPIYIAPSELPRNLLACRLLPVLYDESVSTHIRLLPSTFWSPQFQHYWESAAERRAAANYEPYSIPEQLSCWLQHRPDTHIAAGQALSLARDTRAELDFPGAVHWALAGLGTEDEEAARALMVDVVDHAATPLGLFDGAPDSLGAVLGMALVFSRYGCDEEAARALSTLREFDAHLAGEWEQWLLSLGPGPHKLED